jgi:hypothetical protein
MIRGIVTNDKNGSRILLMVISEGNVVKLKDNLPIHFFAREMEVDKIEVDEVIICYYVTEEDAIKDLTEKGYFGSQTVIVKQEEVTKH